MLLILWKEVVDHMCDRDGTQNHLPVRAASQLRAVDFLRCSVFFGSFISEEKSGFFKNLLSMHSRCCQNSSVFDWKNKDRNFWFGSVRRFFCFVLLFNLSFELP